MPTYTLDTTKISADSLLKVLQAGSNVTLTKIDECTVEISASGGSGGTSNGIKYHLKSGDNVVVEDCLQYFLYCNFILDTNSSITINDGGQLVVHDGTITNDSIIINNGIIKNIC